MVTAWTLRLGGFTLETYLSWLSLKWAEPSSAPALVIFGKLNLNRIFLTIQATSPCAESWAGARQMLTQIKYSHNLVLQKQIKPQALPVFCYSPIFCLTRSTGSKLSPDGFIQSIIKRPSFRLCVDLRVPTLLRSFRDPNPLIWWFGEFGEENGVPVCYSIFN